MSGNASRPSSEKAMLVEDDKISFRSAVSIGGSDVSSTSQDEGNGLGVVRKTSSKRKRARLLMHRIKTLPKRVLLHADSQEELNQGSEQDIKAMESMTDSSFAQHARTFQREHKTVGDVLQDGMSMTKDAVRTVLNPRHHPKREAAGLLTKTEQPFLDEGADDKLLQAHDEFRQVALSAMDGDREAQEELEEKRNQLDEVEAERAAARSAWTLGIHVDRIRAVPAQLVDYPHVSEFDEYDEDGTFVRRCWHHYLGHLLLYSCQGFLAEHVEESDNLPFRRDTLLRTLERLLVATGPWQTWFMHVRKVYLWEDKIETLKWLATFFFLLKTGYILTFAYLWIIYITVKHKLLTDNIRFVREAHDRAQSGATPQRLSELIKRHGGKDWIDPLLDELGPTMQQQLIDLADFLEIIYNFYTWRRPRNTIYTLMFWLTCAVVAASTSTEYGMKIVLWLGGLYFFFSRPIASHYPSYRKAVSLARWVHWNVPTNAELAYEELQVQAQQALAKRLDNQPSNHESSTLQLDMSGPASKSDVEKTVPTLIKTESEEQASTNRLSSSSYEALATGGASDSESDSDRTDLMSFHGKYDSKHGRLIISTTGIRFVADQGHGSARKHVKHMFSRSLAKSTLKSSIGIGGELWSGSFLSLVELRKTLMAESRLEKSNSKLKTNALVVVFNDGVEHKVGGMEERDEAFNAIIGFSGLRFQTLQPLPMDLDGEGGGFVKGGHGKGNTGKGSVLDELSKLTNP